LPIKCDLSFAFIEELYSVSKLCILPWFSKLSLRLYEGDNPFFNETKKQKNSSELYLSLNVNELYPLILEINGSDFDFQYGKVIACDVTVELEWTVSEDCVSVFYIKEVPRNKVSSSPHSHEHFIVESLSVPYGIINLGDFNYNKSSSSPYLPVMIVPLLLHSPRVCVASLRVTISHGNSSTSSRFVLKPINFSISFSNPFSFVLRYFSISPIRKYKDFKISVSKNRNSLFSSYPVSFTDPLISDFSSDSLQSFKTLVKLFSCPSSTINSHRGKSKVNSQNDIENISWE
jgi:hypothetical protein